MKKSRGQLEQEAVQKYRKAAPKWGLSEDDAEKKARRLLPANSDDSLRDFLGRPMKGLSVNSLDPAHALADKEIARMEREVRSVYDRAASEMQEKLTDFLNSYHDQVDQKKADLASGKITQDDYDKWRKKELLPQILQAKQWERMKDRLARDASKSNDIAKNIISGHMAGVYAENYNYGTYEVEREAQVDTSFTLYNADAVERLIAKDQKVLPDPPGTEKWQNKSIKVSPSAMAKHKDIRWNARAIQSELTQGILQGESIPKIAARMQHVQLMNDKAAIRYARTATTGAENAGRNDAYKRAAKHGIPSKKTWNATLDERTRDSHRLLDGETVEMDEDFSNGCAFPGDPDGPDEEVYNCRCGITRTLEGFERDFSDSSWRSMKGLGGKSYDDWKKGHKYAEEE